LGALLVVALISEEHAAVPPPPPPACEEMYEDALSTMRQLGAVST
jgi:hypothetical protein